jgi:Family of unknown function (DUF6496)
MAKEKTRKYGPSAGKDVKSEMHRYKHGTAKSGPVAKAARSKAESRRLQSAFLRHARRATKCPAKKRPDVGPAHRFPKFVRGSIEAKLISVLPFRLVDAEGACFGSVEESG